jgi:hypothetical protein
MDRKILERAAKMVRKILERNTMTKPKEPDREEKKEWRLLPRWLKANRTSSRHYANAQARRGTDRNTRRTNRSKGTINVISKTLNAVYKIAREEHAKRYAPKSKRKTNIECFTALLRPHWRTHYLHPTEEALLKRQYQEHQRKASELGIEYNIGFTQFANLWVTSERFTEDISRKRQ